MKRHCSLIASLAGTVCLLSFLIVVDTAEPEAGGWNLQGMDGPSRIALRWPPFFGQHYVLVGVGFLKGLDIVFWGSTLVLVFSTYWVAAAFLRRKMLANGTSNTKVS